MNELIARHRDDLPAICRRCGVKRLELFGSAARGDFDPAASDFDFFVEFLDAGWDGAARRYFGLLHALEDLFRRPIDLVEIGSVRNPYFLAEAVKHKVTLYAA